MISRKALGAGALLLGGGCLVGAVAVTAINPSPQDAAQARSSPSLPPAVAQVKSQLLSTTITGTCTPSAQEVRVGPPAVGSQRMVVTSLPAGVSSAVQTGALLVTVSGEPMIGLVSTIPFYRSLSEGSRGPDVKALEDGLVAAKLLGRADDTFDSATGDAMGKINSAAGLGGRGLDLNHSVAIPADAIVSAVEVALGQTVTAESSLLVVASAAKQASCLVPASTSVSVGDAVSLVSQAGSAQAKVALVTPVKDSPGQVSLEVASEGVIADGAHLEIVKPQTKQAELTVPAGALITSATGSTQVRKVANGVTTTIDVTVGASAGGWIAVAGPGLAAGDSVALQAA